MYMSDSFPRFSWGKTMSEFILVSPLPCRMISTGQHAIYVHWITKSILKQSYAFDNYIYNIRSTWTYLIFQKHCSIIPNIWGRGRLYICSLYVETQFSNFFVKCFPIYPSYISITTYVIYDFWNLARTIIYTSIPT